MKGRGSIKWMACLGKNRVEEYLCLIFTVRMEWNVTLPGSETTRVHLFLGKITETETEFRMSFLCCIIYSVS